MKHTSWSYQLKSPLIAIVLSVAVCGSVVAADALTGLPDMTADAESANILSLTFDSITYVVADGDLATGTTTRWWLNPDDGDAPVLWEEGVEVPNFSAPPGSIVGGTSTPKDEDVGSNADNFVLTGPNISSLDGINYQETIFQTLKDTFFIFERGGNDAGSYQAILADDSLGPEVPFTKGTEGGPYADTGVSVGQAVYGVAFTTDVPVKGIRINASGHDAFSVSAPIPEPATWALAALGGALMLMRRRMIG